MLIVYCLILQVIILCVHNYYYRIINDIKLKGDVILLEYDNLKSKNDTFKYCCCRG